LSSISSDPALHPLSLHDALPISSGSPHSVTLTGTGTPAAPALGITPSSLTFAARTTGTTSTAQTITVTNNGPGTLNIAAIAISGDRKSTRLNSSHQIISYAVFCL